MKPALSRRWRAAFTAVVSLHLMACATTPPIRFHSLLALDGTARAMPSPSGSGSGLGPPSGLVLTLAAVTLPPQVDRPQWLLRDADGTFSLLEQERWVAPLRAELQSALWDRWANGWNARAAGTLGLKEAAWHVTVDVTRWDAVPGRAVRLESRWTATSGALALTCRSVIQEAAAADIGSPILALAAAHRRAVVRLADEVAGRIADSQKGPPARCAELPA